MPVAARIQPSNFMFLQKLKRNNNREWFNRHKDEYQQELLHVEAFAGALLDLLNSHDQIETPSGKKSLYRIYRDTRFSADKTPYNTRWAGHFTRATKYRRGGYHFNIQPGNSYISGGFWGPETEDLKRIREEIAFDPAPLQKILKNRSFTTLFGSLQGEQLKTAPKGFDNGHEAIDLLRHKQFLLIRRFEDEEVLGPGFLKEANRTYKGMRTFFDYMSDVLTTDSNGLER